MSLCVVSEVRACVRAGAALAARNPSRRKSHSRIAEGSYDHAWHILRMRALVLAGRARTSAAGSTQAWLIAIAPLWVVQRVVALFMTLNF